MGRTFKKKKGVSKNPNKGAMRKKMVEDGAMDGRFKTKAETDKKKKKSKKACRRWKWDGDD